ncbi:uncharacterized protein B0H18DRAFT_390270 [Fomitopsis serialis]|uniref:uncharacterized protein n=1 Tax=Fomitopsis serialis TaxID=139415 RepID=UPI002008C677|nr:uncharacterized protein B0H18DRAFT_390270 [Neoantrodia serialis]KAH9925210.1 hypothetical protein B0H18DRAFT_390270 [Neoantrodia serialis]
MGHAAVLVHDQGRDAREHGGEPGDGRPADRACGHARDDDLPEHARRDKTIPPACALVAPSPGHRLGAWISSAAGQPLECHDGRYCRDVGRRSVLHAALLPAARRALSRDGSREERPQLGWAYCCGLFFANALTQLIMGQLLSLTMMTLQVRFKIQLNSILYAKRLCGRTSPHLLAPLSRRTVPPPVQIPKTGSRRATKTTSQARHRS